MKARTFLSCVFLLSLVLPGCFPQSIQGGVLQVLHVFHNFDDGSHPQAGLTFGPDGLLYGTARDGGAHGNGTAFKVATNGTFTTLFSFSYYTNGAAPTGRLLWSQGACYGTASSGGTNSHGTIFRFTNNAVEVLKEFTNYLVDGDTPQSGLCDGQDGELFGTTFTGYGMVYKIYSSDGAETPLHYFNGTDGWGPYAGLVLNPTNGFFYGTTILGGTNGGWGTVYKISYGGIFDSVFSFSQTNGAHPWASLAPGSHGVLYGSTFDGGLYNYGTVFSVSNDVVRTMASFDYTNGAAPFGELTAAPDGTLYGVARDGGEGGRGTIFQVATNGTLTRLLSFNYGNGSFPYGGMVMGNDGALYGATLDGGSGGGLVFRFIINPPAPTIQSVSSSNNMVGMAWNSVAGGNYRLQSTTNLTTPEWVNLGFPISATNALVLLTDLIDQDTPQKFYRLVLLE